MGRYTGPSCRLCRREGIRLFLKGEKCYSQNCILNKKKKIPGKLPKTIKKLTGYAIQLREKQKVKRCYGLYETQFRKYFKIASKSKGVTGEILIQLLELRLDNLIYKVGFAPSRKTARQLITHKHVLVNNKKLSIPSYIVKVNDEITLSQKAKKMDSVLKSVESAQNKVIPEWLSVDYNDLKFKLNRIPARSEITTDIEINEQLIVELYSK